jgi:hypothetical protein
MSGERWRPPGERVSRDPRRRAWLEEYLSRPQLIRSGVTWGQYAELREKGRWNEFADENLGGLYKVEGE